MPRRRTITSPSFGSDGGGDSGGGSDDSGGGGTDFGEELGSGQRTSGGGGGGGGGDSGGGSDGSGGGGTDFGEELGAGQRTGGGGGSDDPGSVTRDRGGAGAGGGGQPTSGLGAGDDSGPQFGPGPTTDGGLGDPDPGGQGGDALDDTTDDARSFIDTANANDEIVDRATTGGVLSERGGSAGLFPSQLGDGGGAPIGDGRVDISETRLRETGAAASRAGQSLDLGAITSSQAAVVAPFTGGQGVTPTDRDLDPTADAPPGQESAPEEFIEGGAAVPFDLPGAAAEAETASEAGQSLVADDLVEDFGADEVGETATAQGRDQAEQTAGAIERNPAGFAGAVGAGLLAGGAGAAAGSGTASGLRAGLRAEVDPRIGPFGTTLETRAGRGVRDFLDDDRGQAQLLPEERDPDGGDSATGTDDDLGPDLDPFDRSDTRLTDPNREFGDVGGMADDGPTVDPTDAESRGDIGGGIGGRGEPGIVGSDAESFSERGFGDDVPPELDPNPTDTLGDGVSPTGTAGGGLVSVPDAEPTATGAGAGGLLGAAGDLDATGTTPDLGGRTRTVTTPFFDSETDTPTDTDADQPTDTEVDTPTDTDADQPTDTDLFDPPMTDQPTDPPTTDTPTDQPTDRPTDRPTDLPTDQPTDRPRELPFETSDEQDEQDRTRFASLGETSVTNPTRSLAQVDDELVESLDTGGGAGGP